MPIDMGLSADKIQKMDGIEKAILPYRASVKKRFHGAFAMSATKMQIYQLKGGLHARDIKISWDYYFNVFR